MGFLKWVFLLMLYGISDYKFRESHKEEYADEIAYYEQCMEQEKAWIASQQHLDGAIYLYEKEEDGSGVVNPYFACLAAKSLLAGEPDEEDLKRVKNYLNWHTKELIQADGCISDYQVDKSELILKDDYDSVDAYIAVYLSLVAEYGLKGGSLEEIQDVEKAIEICVSRLQELTQNGLTQVSPTNGTYYLMDNVEVLESYRQMERLLTDCAQVADWKKREEFLEYFSNAALEAEDAMKKAFWSEEDNRFEIGMSENLVHIKFGSIERFYPEAIVQLYSIAFDIRLIERDHEVELYNTISNLHSWNESATDGELGWPVLSYIAVQLGDISAAQQYIEEYCKAYNQDRSYPLNTAEAGWTIKGCEALRDYYLELAEKSLLEAIVEKVKRK